MVNWYTIGPLGTIMYQKALYVIPMGTFKGASRQKRYKSLLFVLPIQPLYCVASGRNVSILPLLLICHQDLCWIRKHLCTPVASSFPAKSHCPCLILFGRRYSCFRDVRHPLEMPPLGTQQSPWASIISILLIPGPLHLTDCAPARHRWVSPGCQW